MLVHYKSVFERVLSGDFEVCSQEDPDMSHWASWKSDGQDFYIYIRKADNASA